MSSELTKCPETFIQTKTGNKLYCRYWNEDIKGNGAECRRGLVFIAHGLSEHCLPYSELAENLIKSGFYVFAHDHYGHGQSSGERAYIPRFDDYVSDVLEHVDLVKAKLGDLPVFLIGHSMGGTIAILTANARPNFFKGVVLIGPLVQLDKKAASPFRVFLAKMVGMVFPRISVAKIDPKAMSRCQEEVKKYEEDPLVYHGGVHCGSAVSMQYGVDKVLKSMDQINWPFYVLHGEEDALCDVEGSKLLFDKAASKDKTIKLFPEAYHQLHLELPDVKQETLAGITAWLTDRA